MESSKVFLLLIGICCVVLVGQVHAECCTSFEKLTFRMDRGDCGMVGGFGDGFGDSTCYVSICADGVAIEGAYCGRGPCNMFGCNCDGGCLTGEWSKSFQKKNSRFGITILEASWTPII